LCTDGSELAERALAAGLAVVARDGDVVVVAVVESPDPTLVTGTGMAGGVMSADELSALDDSAVRTAQDEVAQAVTALGLEGVRTEILRGPPGPTLCDFAADAGASVLVIGSRGRGGFKRALLGSVSDYVVRNATCPVVVTSHPHD
jgi:nucleotide-binding universal stress UspA family protein